MDVKKLILGGIVGGVTNFLLGWLFYGILFQNIYPQNENTNLTFIFLGCMTFGFLLSYILNPWHNSITIKKGMYIGASIGFLNSLYMDFFMASNMPWNTTTFVADVVISTIIGTIIGFTIVYVTKKIS